MKTSSKKLTQRIAKQVLLEGHMLVQIFPHLGAYGKQADRTIRHKRKMPSFTAKGPGKRAVVGFGEPCQRHVAKAAHAAVVLKMQNPKLPFTLLDDKLGTHTHKVLHPEMYDEAGMYVGAHARKMQDAKSTLDDLLGKGVFQ